MRLLYKDKIKNNKHQNRENNVKGWSLKPIISTTMTYKQTKYKVINKYREIDEIRGQDIESVSK